MATGAVWTHSRPSAGMLAAYDADPDLAKLRLPFTFTVERMIITLIAGGLALDHAATSAPATTWTAAPPMASPDAKPSAV